MKDIIKKILKEEIHPEFDFIDEGEELLPLRLVELRIMMETLKRMGVKNGVTNKNKSQYIDILKNTFGIKDGVVLSKMVLIGFFNSITDLVIAFKNKDPERLYNGPFYISKLDYWDEEYDVQDEVMDEECDSCGGNGWDEEECYNCGGNGYVEDSDGEEYECSECDGDGKIESDCRQCGGGGTVEVDVTIYSVDNWQTALITKNYIDKDDVLNLYDLLTDDDILRGDKHWIGDHRDEYAGEMSGYTGESEILDQDIIVKTESIIGEL